MQQQCLIERQINGLPMKVENDYKVEFQIRANSGRVVMTFDNQERAREESLKRGLNYFRITTIIEQL